MAKQPKIEIEQIDQTLDQLIAHLFTLKQTVADLREKMAEVSTSTGILPDEQVAALLNRRERTLAKKFH
jgi:prefoldin subunit 5